MFSINSPLSRVSKEPRALMEHLAKTVLVVWAVLLDFPDLLEPPETRERVDPLDPLDLPELAEPL